MSEDASRGSAPRITPGDIIVSPDMTGYTIAMSARDSGQLVPVGMGLSWPDAIHRAHVYARIQQSRVLTSRHGQPFELLDDDDVWLGDRRVWRTHDAATVLRFAPPGAGVYVLRAVTPVLVGETENLRDRLLYHVSHPGACARRHGALEFCVQEFGSADLRMQRAARLAAWWSPPCNDPGGL